MTLAVLKNAAFEAEATKATGREIPSLELNDAAVAFAAARMIQHCKKYPELAHFLAEGVVFESTAKLIQDIEAFFPKTIHAEPVVDDLVVFISDTASKLKQPQQRLTFSYFTAGKLPELKEDGGHQIRIYTDRGTKTANYDQLGMAYTLNGGGSGGASPMDMLKEMTQGLDSGFVLDVNAIISSDAQAAMMKIAALQADIHSLKDALSTAEGPQASSIEAAIAMKAENLTTTLSAVQDIVPTVAVAEARGLVESIKNDFAANQLAHVIDLLSSSLPANQVDGPQSRASAVKESVEAVREAARAEGIDISDALASVLSNADTAPSLSAAISEFSGLMSKPDTLSALQNVLPHAIHEVITTELTTPALSVAAETPISTDVISQQLSALASQTDNEALKQGLTLAATHMDNIGNTGTLTSAIAIPAITTVAENAKVLSGLDNIDLSRADITVIKSEAEALVDQLGGRHPEIKVDQTPIQRLEQTVNPSTGDKPAEPQPTARDEFIKVAPDPRPDTGPRDLEPLGPPIQPPIEYTDPGSDPNSPPPPPYRDPRVDPEIVPELPKEWRHDKNNEAPEQYEAITPARDDNYTPSEVSEQAKQDNANPCQPPNCPCGDLGCTAVSQDTVDAMADMSFDDEPASVFTARAPSNTLN